MHIIVNDLNGITARLAISSIAMYRPLAEGTLVSLTHPIVVVTDTGDADTSMCLIVKQTPEELDRLINGPVMPEV